MNSYNKENVTENCPSDINIPVFEDLGKQERELEKSLKEVNYIYAQKKDMYVTRSSEFNEIVQTKNLMQQKLIVIKEEIFLKNKKLKTLEIEVKELLQKEADLKSDVAQEKHNLSYQQLKLEKNESKMKKYEKDIRVVEANSELGENFTIERKKTEDLKNKICMLKRNIEEFNKVHNKMKLETSLQHLKQEKLKLQNMLNEKTKAVDCETSIYKRKVQEKDVMWKCHQAKKRRLRSEILRMTQVREQQQYEANRLNECIKNFHS